MIRAMIVGDRPVVIDGLRAVLEADRDIEVIGMAPSPEAALAIARDDVPDVALIDARIEEDTARDIVTELRLASPLTECIVLSASANEEGLRAVLSRGARGYLLDAASRSDIRGATRRVAAGGDYIDPAVSGYLARATHAGSLNAEPALTAREIDVLRLAAHGMTNSAIAGNLEISTETVKTHLSRAFQRLGARDRTNAVAICMRRGLI